MRSLATLKFGFIALAALGAIGCLVSDDPVLDASSGRAHVFDPGAYVLCPIGEDATDDECEALAIERGPERSHLFLSEGDDPVSMRFRRIGRKAYAVQSAEDDGFFYYYGAGNSKRFTLTMLSCPALPEALRMRLIESGDLASDDESFSVCAVKSLKGLTAAAKAYHRDEVTSEEAISFLITRSSTQKAPKD